MSTYAHTHLGKPEPLHSQTQGAELARGALRRLGDLRFAPRYELHEGPLAAPWRRVEREALPGAAQTLWRWAEREGYQVAARMASDTGAQVGLARDGILVACFTWSRMGSRGQRLAVWTPRPAQVYATLETDLGSTPRWHVMSMTEAKRVLGDGHAN